MPSLYRVDPRLIHATLMNAWVPEVAATSIVIADGEVSADERRKTILEMSTMDSLPVHFCEETQLCAVLKSLDAAEHERAIVLFSSLDGVGRAVDAGLELSKLSIGHVPFSEEKEELHPAVFLGPKEREHIATLEADGIEVLVQPLPVDEPMRPGKLSKVVAEVEVVNERGLHLRAAHLLAHLASGLSCEITIGRAGAMVNAKSLLGITTLGATKGTRLKLVVEGEDAERSTEAIRDLFARGFDENK